MSKSRYAVLAAVVLALSAGCSSVNKLLSGDRIDYRGSAAKTAPLEVPPDLTQLSRESRFQPQSGSVSASTYASPAAASPAVQPPSVAVQSLGEMRIEREGQVRWLYVPVPVEQLWPQLIEFWQERGFGIAVNSAESGIIETDWAENRAKLPQGGLRAVIGRVLDTLYSTSERDKFRMRVERSPRGGSEITISHRGMEEVFITPQRDLTHWQPRKPDPTLEAEFLSRLMVKLGAPEATAKSALAEPVALAAPPRARVLPGEPPTTLQVDESFDRAWRRVGVALDRSGFTVEDRDRAGGLYFVRYVDPARAGKDEPGFLGRLFGRGKGDGASLQRYRIELKRDGEQRTLVSVLNASGVPEAGDAGKRIVAMLIDDLK